MSRIKKIKKSILFTGRFFTAFRRAFPDYLIIGAQKAGTTSLYNYLIQHPSVKPAFKKEIHYFDSRYRRGNLWYRSFFPYKKELRQGEITGEASPSYIFYPGAAERIYRIFSKVKPEVKLIVLLRNPVDRAISASIHQCRSKREDLPFGEAFKAEGERTRRAKKNIKKSIFKKKKHSRRLRKFAYKERGEYESQLKDYLKYFKRENIFIIFSETFFKNPAGTMKDIYSFLKIDDSFTLKDIRPRNVSSYERYPDIPDSVSIYLKEYFKPYNKKLAKLLRRDLPWNY
ncbi:MAG: sulfotransferase [Elusimicrobia bacterium]|jgi:hypothetical protein|nr:sulfotransferase [Elusimicrobiota bacterium]